MVIAQSPVELAQIRKLLYSVRTSNYDQIQRLCENGAKDLINFNDPLTGKTNSIEKKNKRFFSIDRFKVKRRC